jgi:UPF0716 protein FxsA
MPAVVPLFLFLALPIVEIALFVYVGQWLGVWKTIGLVILAAVLGVAILRYQGLGALRKINRDLRKARPPADGIVDGFMIVVASLLLIIPGFLTDFLGLLLIIPPVRQFVWRLWGRSVRIRTHTSYSRRGGRREDVLDLPPEDFRRDDKPSDPPHRLRDPD